MEKITLVVGASPNPERYSFRAVRTLQCRNIPVIAIGRRDYDADNLTIRKGMPEDIGPVHTITMYLSAKNQKEYYSYILSLQPERIIFNPGTTNDELAEMLRDKGIEVVNDCMLVMIDCGRF
jgi:uncharacterized protein